MNEKNENEEREIFPLVDEDGNETDFELIGEAKFQGKTYYAMIPVNEEDQTESDDGFCEYVILRLEPGDDGDDLVSIDDDEEFDNVADIFDDMFSEEIDYDGKTEKKN